MKKKLWLGTLAVMLVFGMAIVGCANLPDESNELNGVWVGIVEDEVWRTGEEFIPCSEFPSCGGFPSCNNCYYYEYEEKIDVFEVEVEFRFNNGNYEMIDDSIPMQKGTYTTSGDKLTFIPTHRYIDESSTICIFLVLDAGMYSKSELKTKAIDILDILLPYFNEMIDDMFSEWTVTFSVNSNTLIIDEENVLTRK